MFPFRTCQKLGLLFQLRRWKVIYCNCWRRKMSLSFVGKRVLERLLRSNFNFNFWSRFPWIPLIFPGLLRISLVLFLCRFHNLYWMIWLNRDMVDIVTLYAHSQEELRWVHKFYSNILLSLAACIFVTEKPNLAHHSCLYYGTPVLVLSDKKIKYY